MNHSTPHSAASLPGSSGMPAPTNFVSLFHVQRATAPEQGGLLAGKDPTDVNVTDPLRLWIIQLGIIVGTATILSYLLRKVRQPKVIAEVLGGIILGPTAFGRIPGFTKHIFPPESIPFLNLTANIGLCLFLFLVGLEIDATVIKRNARLSIGISLAGMILPFAVGAGLSYPIYKQFISESIKFTHFMLFAGVAFSITAFPVLCRILTELKLLDTTVGIVVLSAGVGNDIVGWTLLALSVALVNAGTGLSALYILLACIGWTLFLLFPVKMALRWVARNTGSVESGPTVVFMTVTVLLLFGSAFFTDAIGVHAIFGAFVAGIIVPREGNLAIALTEKLEDFVAIIFLPLYFTLSGLSTNLGLLNDGITWGYTIAIIATAFFGKFGGCFLAARFYGGFNFREAGAIGSLMSCKGLVELIVLNVGLSAGILTPRVFSMFVLEALILTWMTTPLVTRFYPPHVRQRISASGVPFKNVADSDGTDDVHIGESFKRRFTVVLDKLEHLPGAMAFSQLVHPPVQSPIEKKRLSGEHRRTPTSLKPRPPFAIESLRLIELSDRTSAVMKSSAVDSLLTTDPILAVFRMFGQLNTLPISSAMAIVPYDDLAWTVVQHARRFGSDLVLIPWLPPTMDRDREHVASSLGDQPPSTPMKLSSNNPFEAIFRTAQTSVSGGGGGSGGSAKSAAMMHSQFVRGVFAQAKMDVGVFVDQSGGVDDPFAGTDRQHLFLPFFGGPDDRLALDFVVQVCEGNESLSATVLRMVKKDQDLETGGGMVSSPNTAHLAPGRVGGEDALNANLLTVASALTTSGIPDTVYGHQETHVRMQSETADNIAWARYVSPRSEGGPGSSRIEFRSVSTPIPLHAAIMQARAIGDEWETKMKTRLVVVTGRSRRLAVENHEGELKELMEEYGSVGSEVRKTIGDVATAFVVGRCGVGVVVLQAAAVSIGV